MERHHPMDHLRFTISFNVSPNPTIQIVAHAATPMRGTTPRNKPFTPEVARICLNVDTIVGDAGLVGSFFIDCISTRSTYGRKLEIIDLNCITGETHLEWLVPATEGTTNCGCKDFLPKVDFLILGFSVDRSDTFLRKARDTDSG